jgi:hypothetical protein
MTDLIIVGDEAWLPEEWEARQRRLEKDRERQRTLRDDPEVRARVNAKNREWKRRNRERIRAYNREWMRAYRARKAA